MKKIVLVLCLSIFLSGGFYIYKYFINVATLSYYGSTGQEVINIQSRLSNWGYYNGSIDGIYGWRTSQAIRYFQSSNRLTVDGVAGPSTLAALGLPTGGPNYNSNQGLMARLINGEARGESYVGQVAVGAVVINRTRHPAFPKTIPGVIYQPGAFTAVDDGQINASLVSSATKAASDALNGWDPTSGSIYYFNPNTATSAWIWSRPQVMKIGSHIFTR